MGIALSSAELHIANDLRLSSEDLAAAKLLLAAGDRFSAYHLQQCAEKVLRALLTAEGVQIERKDAHRLDVLLDKLPAENPFKARLKPLSHLTMFATTYRYPKDGGRLPTAPSKADVDSWAVNLAAIVSDAATHFRVDLNASDRFPAGNSAPPRNG